MSKKKEYKKLAGASPDEYIGRMNTPSAHSDQEVAAISNPHNYIGRMDTPPALKKQFFCPFCGIEFPQKMIDLVKLKIQFYCESCGENIDPSLFQE
ncbi:hypothetical protein DSAG12_00189 [Promethearchaeum syntrophicum]|uniref:Uncharacterized protein n=1 Tax=Promethearchaeum syntrophicum TaxID=2594042 RepID=A0A5B9D5X2_9ARCH|nr:hypothetical protein [Candidatus Prometheoarchaeum syntrophicum]QEE14376.1 hypothetical protein DSAG12_00189 [Candidatus Prometheoarchaeum syntrophicum]